MVREQFCTQLCNFKQRKRCYDRNDKSRPYQRRKTHSLVMTWMWRQYLPLIKGQLKQKPSTVDNFHSNCTQIAFQNVYKWAIQWHSPSTMTLSLCHIKFDCRKNGKKKLNAKRSKLKALNIKQKYQINWNDYGTGKEGIWWEYAYSNWKWRWTAWMLLYQLFNIWNGLFGWHFPWLL